MDSSRWNCSSWTPKGRFSGQRKWTMEVSDIFYFHPSLKKWSNLTIIFFKWVGWQPPPFVVYCHRQGTKNQIMKKSSIGSSTFSILPSSGSGGAIYWRSTSKDFPKRFKNGPEGFLQNIRLMQLGKHLSLFHLVLNIPLSTCSISKKQKSPETVPTNHHVEGWKVDHLWLVRWQGSGILIWQGVIQWDLHIVGKSKNTNL